MRYQITSYELLKSMLQTIPAGDACLEWPRAIHKKGYAVDIWTPQEKRYMKVHRLAYALMNGPIPDGLLVCHRCDNRKCFRPDHLFPGTDLDNARDCNAKGRREWNYGEKNGFSRLTEDQVREIRHLRSIGVKLQPIADRFGICITSASNIANRRLWRHI